MAIDKDPNQLWLADVERIAGNLRALGDRLRTEGVISEDDALVIATSEVIMLSSAEQLKEFRDLMHENERLKEEKEKLKEERDTDSLTGAKNKRGFHESLREKLQDVRVRNFKGHVAIAYIDLDGFKKFNDRFGHEKGDDALKEVMDRLRDHFRATDHVACRPGGDEIVLILPYEHGGQFDHDVVKGKVREALKGLYVWDSVTNQPFVIGASIGVCSTDDLAKEFPSNSDDPDVYELDDEAAKDKMITMADQRMYLDKWHNGEYTEENREDMMHPKNQRLEVLRQEAREDYARQNHDIPFDPVPDDHSL